MFILKRLSNWAHSSVRDDRQELESYQKFIDTFTSIDSKIEEYIYDLSYDDERLKVDLDGKKVPINFIEAIKDSVLHDKNLSVEERAFKSAELNRMYYEKLKELKNHIIDLAVNCTDNSYLAYLHSCIQIINNLLKEFGGLIAIQKSGIKVINNDGMQASEKMRILKEQIEIRSAEIQTRLSLEDMRKK